MNWRNKDDLDLTAEDIDEMHKAGEPVLPWSDPASSPIDNVRAYVEHIIIDPDCRSGKHTSCVGGPCLCTCHDELM